MTEKTIGELLPMIDKFIAVYEEHRALIGMALGNVKVSQISQIVDMIKGFTK